MGASVIAYWPGITEEQIDSQPGFWNDCKAWGNWMAEREDEPDVLQLLRDFGAGALLTYKTDGMEDDEVEWVTPGELMVAAQQLQEILRKDLPGVDRILTVYARNANNLDPVAEEFVQDLRDIEEIARWAQEQGTHRVTLEVNW